MLTTSIFNISYFHSTHYMTNYCCSFNNCIVSRSQQLGVYSRLTTIQQDLLEHSTSPSTTTTISSNSTDTAIVNAIEHTLPAYPYCTTNTGASTTTRRTSPAHATLTLSSLIPPIPHIPAPLVSSRTELLLNTIPYFKNITYTLRQYSGNNIVPVPIYSERIDWLIEHIYSNSSSNSDVPTAAVGMVGVIRNNTRSDGSNRGRYTTTSSGGSGGGDMGNTLLQHQQLIVGEHEEIDEFE